MDEVTHFYSIQTGPRKVALFNLASQKYLTAEVKYPYNPVFS